MKPFFKILLTFLLLIIFISCNGKNPTEPEPQSGRRDYVWTVDTLKLPPGEFITLLGIWGANPNDVWACGRGSSDQYRLWHFDGNKWTSIETGFTILDPTRIFGFSNNNIWLGTALGVIAHFNGVKWTSFGNLSTASEFLVVQGIWGTRESDLYAFGFLDKKDRTGYEGCILRYDGVTWKYLDIEKLSLNFVSMGYDKDSQKYFLSAYRSEDGMQFIYELSGNKLTKLFESKVETKVFVMNNKAYFMIGRKIYKYSNNDGLYVWKDFSTDPIYAGIFEGRNEKDIFTINWGGIGHYNGNDIAMLYQTDLWFNNVSIFDKEIFIPAKNYQSGINAIIHGKLKN